MVRFPVNVTSRVTLSNFRTTLRRAQCSQRPPQPHSLAELGNILGIPSNGHLLRSVDGEENLYLGMAGNSLVLGSMRLLVELSRSECVFLDSTFFAVPVDVGAEQLFTVVIIRDHHVCKDFLLFTLQICCKWQESFVSLSFFFLPDNSYSARFDA